MAFVPRAARLWRLSLVALVAVSFASSPALSKTATGKTATSKAAPKTATSKAAPKTATSKAAPKTATSKPAEQQPGPIPADIRELGPMSVGHPHAGYLVNGVKLPNSDDWVITVPSQAYGTEETNDALALCIGQVRRDIPDSPKVMLGSLSAERGGHLPPHKSHRTGRDVDVYFFRQPGAQWSRAATESDIDLRRTWALLRCFVTQTDVDMVLIDKKVQGWLENYALSVGEDPDWVKDLFHDHGSYKTAVVRHVPGHVAHMHVRFVSPEARRLGVKYYDRLVEEHVVVPDQRGIVHVVAKGDTLSGLASRYGVKVDRIRELNQLGSTLIRTGQKLTIEQPVDIRGARDRVVVPPRHVPPGAPEHRVRVVATPRVVAPSEPEVPEASPPTPPGPPPRQSTEPVGHASS
jgi:LysM repeat protein/murein endopeptidase